MVVDEEETDAAERLISSWGTGVGRMSGVAEFRHPIAPAQPSSALSSYSITRTIFRNHRAASS